MTTAGLKQFDSSLKQTKKSELVDSLKTANACTGSTTQNDGEISAANGRNDHEAVYPTFAARCFQFHSKIE